MTDIAEYLADLDRYHVADHASKIEIYDRENPCETVVSAAYEDTYELDEMR